MIQKILFTFLLLLGIIPNFYAQINSIQQSSKIAGEVITYHDGAVIPNVKIIIESDNFRRETKTDNAGKYEIELPVGIYKISTETDGFRKFKRKKVKINGKGGFTLNITLRLGKLVVVDEAHP